MDHFSIGTFCSHLGGTKSGHYEGYPRTVSGHYCVTENVYFGWQCTVFALKNQLQMSPHNPWQHTHKKRQHEAELNFILSHMNPPCSMWDRHTTVKYTSISTHLLKKSSEYNKDTWGSSHARKIKAFVVFFCNISKVSDVQVPTITVTLKKG